MSSSETKVCTCARDITRELGGRIVGDLWMWLKLMWLQFEVVRGRSGSFGVDLKPKDPQSDPKATPNNPDRTSDNLKLQPYAL